jgi:hypothetical protein
MDRCAHVTPTGVRIRGIKTLIPIQLADSPPSHRPIPAGFINTRDWQWPPNLVAKTFFTRRTIAAAVARLACRDTGEIRYLSDRASDSSERKIVRPKFSLREHGCADGAVRQVGPLRCITSRQAGASHHYPIDESKGVYDLLQPTNTNINLVVRKILYPV